ncbi:hypothetical protein C2845_PM13G01980 [Panicum miliaceum]|uniref:KIB1-4 beta-propeller domain-containing protein n=1 Tax=Panicum miliaceum TaxID=4540 RepID=A0A3L6RIM2_PANMI|nr:hypothetical protein C2845_PM13G01980 [Panicum miliaceum]
MADVHLALPNGRVFSYPELTPSRLLDEKAAGYVGAACDDWLLFHDAGGLFRLTSPFIGKTRLLPSFDGIRAHDVPVEIVNEPAPSHRAVESHAQWRGDDETMGVRKVVVCPDGFIAAIFGREHFAKVALCSLETFSWSHSKHDRWRWYDDLAFFGGRLYAVTAGKDLLGFDVGVDGDTGEPFISRVERVIEGAPYGPRSSASAMVHYLLPSGDGALLMVRRRFPHAVGNSLERFTVFRADLASSRWEEVSSLGCDQALFVWRLCSRAVRGRRYPLGYQIFFLPDDCAGMSFWEPPRRRANHHAAVYGMFDGRVTYLLPRQPRDDGDGTVPVTWLFPAVATAREMRR